MFSRSAQVFAVLTLVELVVFAFAVTRFNALVVILLVLASSAFGMSFLFRQTAGMLRRSVEDMASAGHGVEADLGDRSLHVAGAALLSFPGLVSGFAGALLMVSPARSALRPLIGSRISRRIPAEYSAPMADLDRLFRRHDVVDVEAVRKDPQGSSANTSAPPELR